MSYFLAPALVRLRDEVNARWPGRSKVSDGWIGDTAHSARTSDHNPDWAAGGIVRAIDVTNAGIDVDGFINLVIRDPRTRYVISRGRIWTREAGWSRYTGSNGHYAHVHVSVRSVDGHDRNGSSWHLALPAPAPAPAAVPDVPEDNDMIIRRKSDGASFIVLGGRGSRLVKAADSGAFQAAGVPEVSISDEGYAVAEQRYLVGA